MIAWALRQLVMWGMVAVLVYGVVGSRLVTLLHPPADPGSPAPVAAPVAAPERAPAAAAPSVPVGTQWNGEHSNAMIFHANPQGHVILQGFVDNSSTRFMVDTGATMVALSLRDAQAAGLDNGRLVYSGMVSTASGVARVAPVRLRELRIGQYAMNDVDAVVVDGLGISLLGQSFLKRLDSYEMRDGVLTLYWN